MAVNQDVAKKPRGYFVRQTDSLEGIVWFHLNPEEKNPGQSDFVLT
jgi:hypothetical protein